METPFSRIFSTTAAIRSPHRSSPKGWAQSGVRRTMTLAASRTLSGSRPLTMFAPISTVSTHSVLSRRVTQGTRKIHASCWTPPESVSTNAEEPKIEEPAADEPIEPKE